MSAPVRYAIRDRARVSVLLLEECNRDCPHCLRDEEPMPPGYRLAGDELTRALADCARLPRATWLHFSGGEPTLWTEGDRDLVDLLVEVAGAGLDPSFTTNGSTLLTAAACEEFLGRYFAAAGRTLILWFSVDTFHGNFDASGERAPCVDRMLEARDRLPPHLAELLDLRVTATVSRSPDTLLPPRMVERYRSRGVRVHIAPLRCAGRARALRDECPDLEAATPEALGAFGAFHGEWRQRQGEVEARAGADVATALILIGSRWYLHHFVPGFGSVDRWLLLGPVGGLPEDLVRAYARG